MPQGDVTPARWWASTGQPLPEGNGAAEQRIPNPGGRRGPGGCLLRWGRVYDGREALVSGGVQAAASSALIAAHVEPRRR